MVGMTLNRISMKPKIKLGLKKLKVHWLVKKKKKKDAKQAKVVVWGGFVLGGSRLDS